ncbi:MAG: hypothetical protein IJ808_00445 [Muribaculaceae bacterium]|nr:hypothetical protein [Muribaculaceae bacterium]
MERIKTIVLWGLIMIGLANHSIIDLLPLFWSVNIAIDSSGVAPQAMLVMMSCLSYLIPVAAILCLLYGKNRLSLYCNLTLALLMLVFCVLHAAVELPSDNTGQYVLMFLMIVVSVLLAMKSWRLVKKS